MIPSEGFDYSKIFEVTLTSSVDGSIASGNFIGGNSRRFLEEAICTECEAAHMGFTWRMEDHNTDGMEIKLDFENPERISTSSYGQDQIKINVKDYTMFRSV
jgi:hypothetical protein